MQVHHTFITLSFGLALLVACAENPSGSAASQTGTADTTIAPPDTTLMGRLVANSGDALVNFNNTAAEDTVFNCSSTLRYLGRMTPQKKGPKYHLQMYQYEFGPTCSTHTRLLVYNEQHELLGYYPDLEAVPIEIVGPSVLFRYRKGREILDGNFTGAIPKTLLTSPFNPVDSPREDKRSH